MYCAGGIAVLRGLVILAVAQVVAVLGDDGGGAGEEEGNGEMHNEGGCKRVTIARKTNGEARG